MTHFRRIAVTFAGALLLAASPAMAAERTLFTIESALTPKPVALSILDTSGVQHPDTATAFSRWTIKPGDPLRVNTQPSDRVVDLFTGTTLAPTLLCRVVLRYYRGSEGWKPQFRLEEQPAVAYVNGRWQPIGDIGGLVRFGNTLPNADGFSPTIEFGASAGDLAIVAWQTR
jgi:hypothetical protein